MSENLSKLAGRKGLDNPLFEKLVAISKEQREPDPNEMRSLAKEFLVGNANVYGTVSFYDFLKAENQSKKYLYAMAALAWWLELRMH